MFQTLLAEKRAYIWMLLMIDTCVFVVCPMVLYGEIESGKWIDSGCLRDCLIKLFCVNLKGASVSPVFSWHFKCDIMTIVVLNCIAVCWWGNFLFVGYLPIICWQMYCRRVACLSNLQFVFVRMQHSVVYLAKWMIFTAFFIRFTCFVYCQYAKNGFESDLLGPWSQKSIHLYYFFSTK